MTDNQRTRKATEIHKAIVGTFETELGKKCLVNLIRAYVDRRIYNQGQSFEATAYRQGQADVIKDIIKEINNG